MLKYPLYNEMIKIEFFVLSVLVIVLLSDIQKSGIQFNKMIFSFLKN